MFSISILGARAANIIAAPGEAGLRAAITAAQSGDTVTLTNFVEITASVRINKPITLRSTNSETWNAFVSGAFDGELFQLATNGILIENLRLYGSFQTDALRMEGDTTLRNCVIQAARRPVVFEGWWSWPPMLLRLENVLVTDCREGLSCQKLEAKDCTFTQMGGYYAVGVNEAVLERCKFERNIGDGLGLAYGTIKDCTFRFNGQFGVRFDPDPGLMNLSGSLFYGNAGGGILLGEQGIATVDNCTFTRHTESPAIIVTQSDGVLLRHCTIVDNLLINPDSSPWYPWGGALAIHSGPVEIQNCLIAENPTSDDPEASGISGIWIDRGGNIIGGSAGLGVLRNNGGPTYTMLPQPGSAAINAGVASELVVDARGLSRVAGSAPDAGAVEANAAAVADADNDALPDVWENFHSLNPSSAADATSDTDGDGRNALAEFQARTNPRDAQSALRIEEFLVTPDYADPTKHVVTFKWRFVSGATYQVESSTDLQHWQPAAGYSHLEGIGPDIRALKFTVVTGSPRFFYRLTVVD